VVLFLLDNAPAPRALVTHKKTDKTGLPISRSPSAFPEFDPVGLPRTTRIEKQLNLRHFSSDTKVIAAMETWLDGKYSEFLEINAKVKATG
jgi:hypothetical protein